VRKKALALSAVPLIVVGGLSFTLLVGGAGNSSAAPPCTTSGPGISTPSPVAGPLTSTAPVKLPTSVGPYKSEQILNAAHIIKAGQDLNLPPQGLTIAVMTARASAEKSVPPPSPGCYQYLTDSNGL
jgi:hypothetical protein